MKQAANFSKKMLEPLTSDGSNSSGSLLANSRDFEAGKRTAASA